MLLSMKERRKETSDSWLRFGSRGSSAISRWVIYLPSLHGQRALAIQPSCSCETQLFMVVK